MTLHTAPRRHPLLSLVADTPSWDGAECTGYPPEWWFVDDHANAAAQSDTAAAKDICNGHCPIVDQCRGWALAHPELTQYGVFGGLTAAERGGTVHVCDRDGCDQTFRRKDARQRFCSRQCSRAVRNSTQKRHYRKKEGRVAT